MKSIKKCFCVNTYQQAFNTIEICKKNNIEAIIYIKYFIANGFGHLWIKEFLNLILANQKRSDFKIYIDCKKNYGLFFSLVELKIDYIKVDGTNKILKRLKQICKKNKVVLNPKFSVVDISKIKNIKLKILKSIKVFN